MASPKLQAIEDYNREDCDTVFLHDWLLKLRHVQGLPEQPLQHTTDEDHEAREAYPLERLSQRLLDELPDPLTDPKQSAEGMSWRANNYWPSCCPSITAKPGGMVKPISIGKTSAAQPR